MELQGTHQFKAPLSDVWAALLDPTVLAKALPGGDQLEQVGENDYKAAMNVRVGPVQGRFEGKVTLSDVVQFESYRMKVSGTGSAGFLNGEGSLALQANDEGTLLTYNGDVQIGGRIAAVGQRLVDSTAKSIIRQGLKTLDDQLQNGGSKASAAEAMPAPIPVAVPTPAPPSESAPRATPTPSPAAPPPLPTVATAPRATEPAPAFGKIAVDVMKDVAQDLASDYVPREKQPQVFAFILGALAMLLFVLLVRVVQRD
jgi:carbon monoxide dehydrogenase subunit G